MKVIFLLLVVFVLTISINGPALVTWEPSANLECSPEKWFCNAQFPWVVLFYFRDCPSYNGSLVTFLQRSRRQRGSSCLMLEECLVNPPPTSSLLAPRSQQLCSPGPMFAENVCRLHSMPLPRMISSQAANLGLLFGEQKP